MIYREGVLADVPAIVALCNEHGGYAEIDARVVRTGGTWYVAVEEATNDIVGCVWFITDRQHASIDYLAIRQDYQSPAAYREVLAKLKTFLNNNGINFFHGCIRRPNGDWYQIEGNSYAPLPDNAVMFYEQRQIVE